VKKFPVQVLLKGFENFYDTDIVYGASYVYKIRNMFAVEYDFINYVDDDPTETQLIRGLFFCASKPDIFRADAIDRQPPEPPKNLKFKFFHDKKTLKIHWDFPYNPQRDIKGFQVFRRKSTNESFTLIGELNFNDAFVLPRLSERAPASDFYFLKKQNGEFVVKRTFFDDQFDDTSEFIYAIASVDAHGLTSNYSQQIKVKFNRVFNKKK
jgi:hypothetical protein